ncbi:hypothetical protein K469DRAFT_755037 [Zopfia rhizophila CBS 207.26]|uniref:Uncharacterized protein n=1 Tax=Zopfia rhizophila CBS 207.26 TaxID=1314779 RepID=A0A6A6DDQ0_9PEZI|nr:hypothetical protein K469DRAFT_755037 [Zopfia rhizophila CBS 207.26]
MLDCNRLSFRARRRVSQAAICRHGSCHMGLIPLTLKDIAWPERRIIYLTKTLNPTIEVLVLALGLVPVETGDGEVTREKAREGNTLAKKTWRHHARHLREQAGATNTQSWKNGHALQIQAHSDEDLERKKKFISAVQSADEDWPVQLAWGVYYIAGTLIFTSIMAVTVIELVVWVGLGFAVSGTSKLLAFFLCLAFDETRGRISQGSEWVES